MNLVNLNAFPSPKKSMTRLITAPVVGAVAGALEMGVVFFILTVIDEAPSGPNNEFVYLGAAIGIILGSFVGGVIGLIVALLNAGRGRGLLIGTLVGLAIAIYLFVTTSYHDDMHRMLAVIVVPAASSIGLIAAALTAGRKAQQSSDETDSSHRIIS